MLHDSLPDYIEQDVAKLDFWNLPACTCVSPPPLRWHPDIVLVAMPEKGIPLGRHQETG
jgi:hypothetical protein